MPNPNESYYGQFYIPPHTVRAARQRFPKFTACMSDADVRKHLDDHVAEAQTHSKWQAARKHGEFVCAVPAGDEGTMYPIVVPSTQQGFEWCLVSVMTEKMKQSWHTYPPEMPNPKLIFVYEVNGQAVFERLHREEDIPAAMMAAAAKGASHTSMEVYRQTPFSLVAKTKR